MPPLYRRNRHHGLHSMVCLAASTCLNNVNHNLHSHCSLVTHLRGSLYVFQTRYKSDVFSFIREQGSLRVFVPARQRSLGHCDSCGKHCGTIDAWCASMFLTPTSLPPRHGTSAVSLRSRSTVTRGHYFLGISNYMGTHTHGPSLFYFAVEMKDAIRTLVDKAAAAATRGWPRAWKLNGQAGTSVVPSSWF